MSALLKEIAHPGEQWLAVPGFEGRIYVSDRGRAINLDYRGYGEVKIYAGWGVTVPLYKNGSGRSVELSCLVYQLFVGPIPASYEVNHIDGNRGNNSVQNLEAITSRENGLHARRTGLLGRNTVRRDECLRLMRANGIDVEAVLAHDALVRERAARPTPQWKPTGIKIVPVIVGGTVFVKTHRPVTPVKSNQPRSTGLSDYLAWVDAPTRTKTSAPPVDASDSLSLVGGGTEAHHAGANESPTFKTNESQPHHGRDSHQAPSPSHPSLLPE